MKPWGAKPLRTLADVRAYILDKVPVERHDWASWQHVGRELMVAAETSYTHDITTTLEMVLFLEGSWER